MGHLEVREDRGVALAFPEQVDGTVRPLGQTGVGEPPLSARHLMAVFPLDAAVFPDKADVYLAVRAAAPRGTREQDRRLAVDELGILERADLAAGVDVYAGIAQTLLLFPRGTAVARNRIPAVACEQIEDAVDFDVWCCREVLRFQVTPSSE